MGIFTADIHSFDDLFVHQLQDIYYAESQIVKTLPKMIEKATDQQLKDGFKQHLEETRTHVTRLEQVFQMHGVEPKAVDCPAIDGILKEGNEVAGDIDDKMVLDAALAAAAQAVEHYEISRYGTMIAWAEELGLDDAVSLLEETLEEEEATDEALTEIAKTAINQEAEAA